MQNSSNINKLKISSDKEHGYKNKWAQLAMNSSRGKE